MDNVPVQRNFSHKTIILPLENILPTRAVDEKVLKSAKFHTILNSIKELGIIEPLMVYPENMKDIDKNKDNFYILLDGHLRLEALKASGGLEAICLISNDDESFTYNRQINRINSIQEYRMIVAAINKGVSTEKIARVLNINVESINRKLNMLSGIAPEVIVMLKDRMVPHDLFKVLKKMKGSRQIEVAKLMISANRFSKLYAEMMLAGTKPELLIDKKDTKKKQTLSPMKIAKMQEEMEQLQKNYAHIEDTAGDITLSLVVAKGYVSKLLSNDAIKQHIAEYHEDIYNTLTTVMGSILMNPSNLEKE